MTEEETHEKEAVKTRFFAIFHPFFLLLIGLIFYFAGLSYFIHDINTSTLSELTESFKFPSSLLQAFFKLEIL